ncbi:MAG: hypothetical protein UV70_C0006G0033 [Parcubacteria group bacterium GW2011_GWA2_43_13]|nr:MAG: hypothetical protein UV70_C0006G0033 [Parcubacteria group bacterium GW2011_GWA2_43_13]OGY68883.1 MAG: hypothetical protein A3B94_00995 [Candidatus Jacksonbacteria bacterium RIFCSPHIGHO2_02_FULL_43_10]OGY70296.1 MAG: hypothetical protein A2986_04510 [Candidatus Jacksonbacteria bacterium RIFCSPLOWO2_01_FULL_44_13]HAZ16933.1 hypothetical protein [Candidatus Jacksonbacteria bacterium]
MALSKKKCVRVLMRKKFTAPLWLLLVIGSVIVVVLGRLFFLLSHESEYQSLIVWDDPLAVRTDPRLQWWLDGRAVEREEDARARPYAVMIDQGIDSGVPAGLDKASVVVEALVEGGVTRLMALFDPIASVEKIGPVRSVRPYFADWAQGFDAVLVHAGGSPTALKLISITEIDELNEISGDGMYFFRDPYRSAPHNLFIASSRLPWKKKEWRPVIDQDTIKPWDWARGTTDGIQGNPGSSILVDFSRTSYTVEWKQKNSAQSYQRFRNGIPEVVESDKAIFADNIIVQYIQVGLEDELRLTMQTIGEGKTLICSAGECADGIWKREKDNQPTQFFIHSQKGDRLAPLLPGATWIEVVPEGKRVTFQ